MRPLQLRKRVAQRVERLPDSPALVNLIGRKADQDGEVGIRSATGVPLGPFRGTFPHNPIRLVNRLLGGGDQLFLGFVNFERLRCVRHAANSGMSAESQVADATPVLVDSPCVGPAGDSL
jgi:hypothetical protein